MKKDCGKPQAHLNGVNSKGKRSPEPESPLALFQVAWKWRDVR